MNSRLLEAEDHSEEKVRLSTSTAAVVASLRSVVVSHHYHAAIAAPNNSPASVLSIGLQSQLATPQAIPAKAEADKSRKEAVASSSVSYKVERYALKNVSTFAISDNGKISQATLNGVKVMVKDPGSWFMSYQSIQSEFEMLKFIGSSVPHIVPFLGGDISSPRNPYLVTRYMSLGSLRDVLKSDVKLSWVTNIRMMQQTTLALQNLKERGIVHRDIKSANIFVESLDWVCVGDLGSARRCNNQAAGYVSPHPDAIGTDGWIAPELYGQKVKTYNEKTDMFSLGTVLWEFAARPNRPFNALQNTRRHHQIQPAVMRGELDKIPESCPPGIAKLIIQCRSIKAADRPSYEEFSQSLNKTLLSLKEVDASASSAPATLKK